MRGPEVPVIAVFTKYDQFKVNVQMDLEDDADLDQHGIAEERFREHYLYPLGDGASFVQLESVYRV
jgi:hypothetical protein